MESTCPFYPKGKHSAKDFYSLKDYVEKHSKGPARDQDGPDRNPGHHAGGPVFPNPEHQLNMIYEGRMRTSPSGSRSSLLGRSTQLLRLLPNISNGRKPQSLSAGPTIRTMFLIQDATPGVRSDRPD